MNNIFKKIKENAKLLAISLLIGLSLGWIFFHSSTEKQNQNNNPQAELHEHGEEAHQIWTCSMHPQIKKDKPGKCPICSMELIPLVTATNSTTQKDPNEIVLSESAIKLASIQTTIVKRGPAEHHVILQGKIQADERRIAELTARFGGRIEKLYVNFTGQRVQKGEKLASLYSPSLISAQRELMEAIQMKDSRPALYKAAKAKLKLWELSDAQISQIENSGEPMLYFDILSPISGTVSMRHVAVGDYVKEATALFQIIDLSHVWGIFDAYENDLPWINLHDDVDFTVAAFPGEKYHAQVSYIDPFIQAKSRTSQIRIDIDNRKEKLKPEMFLRGEIVSKMMHDNEILIPKSSILWTGKRAVVYIKVAEREYPSFVYREIELGPQAGNYFIVRNGLQEGEEIATNGVFKIDAAAQLQGLASMMNPDGNNPAPAHHHAGMKMDQSKKKSSKIEKPGKKTLSQLQNVLENYLALKNALFDGNTINAQKSAKDLQEALKSVDMKLLKGEAHLIWMKELESMQASSKSINKKEDLKEQRKAFSVLSLNLYNVVKAFGVEKDTIYFQYCPMANSKKGAYWLSELKDIKNPYFGAAMPGCGENRETFVGQK